MELKDQVFFRLGEANRNGKVTCPFHSDEHPSMHIYDDHYHCYQCGSHGSLVQLLGTLGVEVARARRRRWSSVFSRSRMQKRKGVRGKTRTAL